MTKVIFPPISISSPFSLILFSILLLEIKGKMCRMETVFYIYYENTTLPKWSENWNVLTKQNYVTF